MKSSENIQSGRPVIVRPAPDVPASANVSPSEQAPTPMPTQTQTQEIEQQQPTKQVVLSKQPITNQPAAGAEVPLNDAPPNITNVGEQQVQLQTSQRYQDLLKIPTVHAPRARIKLTTAQLTARHHAHTHNIQQLSRNKEQQQQQHEQQQQQQQQQLSAQIQQRDSKPLKLVRSAPMLPGQQDGSQQPKQQQQQHQPVRHRFKQLESVLSKDGLPSSVLDQLSLVEQPPQIQQRDSKPSVAIREAPPAPTNANANQLQQQQSPEKEATQPVRPPRKVSPKQVAAATTATSTIKENEKKTGSALKAWKETKTIVRTNNDPSNWSYYLFLAIFLIVLLILIITLVITRSRKS